MADTYYAWSNIRAGGGKDEEQKTVKVGDKVSAGDLGMDDEQFQELVDGGVVRTIPYPEGVNTDESPVEMYKRQMNEAMEVAMTEAGNEAFVSNPESQTEAQAQSEESKAQTQGSTTAKK